MIRRNVAPIQILWTLLKKKIELKEPAAPITITFVKFVKSVSTNILLSGKSKTPDWKNYFTKFLNFKTFFFRHHVLSSVDLHKQLKKKERKRKEAELEYECVDCCIAFQDRKSHQTHMVEEHSESAGNPFYCQKCNVYLKVSYIGNYILIPINCKLNIKKNVPFNSKFNFYFFFPE